MNISDIIQIISIVATFIISIISIRIALASLKQTAKITEEANQPYIALYYDSVNVIGYEPYLILKNFGKTGAIIDSVSYTPTFKERHNSKPFSKLSNYFIAPNQKITTACDLSGIKNAITFTVKYHSSVKTFSESFVINPEAISNVIIGKIDSSEESEVEKIISHSVQELIRTNL